MTTAWQTETEEEQPKDEQPKLDYQVKAHIALEDSDDQTWGIVKDTEGDYGWKTGGGATIGTWSRSPSDGLIHVFLETPIMALVDKATQHFAEYAEKRRADLATLKSGSRTPRTPRTPKAPPEPSEEQVAMSSAISNMRKLLSK